MTHLPIEYHMTDDEFLRMRSKAVTPEEKDRLMKHIAECDLCAKRLAELFEEGPLLETSPLFYENVLKEIEQTSEEGPGVFLPKGKREEYTPKALKSYPFQVALAACMTLILMSSGMFGSYVDAPPRGEKFLNPSIESWDRLNQFSHEMKEMPKRWMDIMEGEIKL